jgi:cephalosporin hydroxylase
MDREVFRPASHAAGGFVGEVSVAVGRVVSSSSAPRRPGRAALPPPVSVTPDTSVASLWRRRIEQHTDDWYMGLRIQKFPEDLRVYEHLLWEYQPNVVIELGGHRGGSALWFRDRLAALARYRPLGRPLIVTVSLDTGPARAGIALRDPDYADSMLFVDGDVRDPDLPDVVAAVLPDQARCLVVENTTHEYDTTAGALAGFARFVPPGGYFVVEGGIVDVPGLRPMDAGWGGVLEAIDEWLATDDGAAFTVRRDLELYGLTTCVRGWLRRRPSD